LRADAFPLLDKEFCGVMDVKVDVKGAYDSPKTAENFCNKKVLSCVD
jgi:hypothetical protein